jgi:hypothetical protein
MFSAGKGAAAAHPAGDLHGVGQAGGSDEADGSGGGGVMQAPGLVGEFMGVAVAAFAQGFEGEEDGVVGGHGDLPEHGQIAPALAATAGVAKRDFSAAVRTEEVHG